MTLIKETLYSVNAQTCPLYAAVRHIFVYKKAEMRNDTNLGLTSS